MKRKTRSSITNNSQYFNCIPYIRIPYEILIHSKLTWFEKILFGYLEYHTCRKERCTLSNRYFATAFNISNHTISIALKNLKQAHFLIIKYTKKSILNDTQQIRQIWINSKYPKIYSIYKEKGV